MSDFRIFETDEFWERIERLPSRDAAFLRKKLDSFVYPQIKTDPYWGNNIKKLKGYSPDTWRYRIGRFRLFYSIEKDEHIISMLTVDDRKDTYK